MREDFDAHAIDSGGWCLTCSASAYVCQREGFRREWDRAELAERRLTEKDQEIARLREELGDMKNQKEPCFSAICEHHEARLKAEARVKELEGDLKTACEGYVPVERLQGSESLRCAAEAALAAKEKELAALSQEVAQLKAQIEDLKK